MTILMVLGALFMPSSITNEKAPPCPVQIEADEVMVLARDYRPERATALAIARAARVFGIDFRYLGAIAIIESSFGRNIQTRINPNGTIDKGLFQINSVNFPKCREFILDSVQGSAMCAAKLLAEIKTRRPDDYFGVFHSKTPSKKIAYMKKVQTVLMTREVASVTK